MESEHPPCHYAHEILDVLTDEGLPAERVVLGHQDMIDELDHPEIDDQLELAERGAFVEFDLWGWEAYITSQEHAAPSDNWRAKATMEFIDEGLHSQLLFSHDVNHKWQRTKYGGHGYGHLLENIVPMLESHGVDSTALDEILIENPRRVLTFAEPQ
jgi:phosphotriesterase-related protein